MSANNHLSNNWQFKNSLFALFASIFRLKGLLFTVRNACAIQVSLALLAGSSSSPKRTTLAELRITTKVPTLCRIVAISARQTSLILAAGQVGQIVEEYAPFRLA